jgi:predicted  nucleic acid-binding Zn-ribbon protein
MAGYSTENYKCSGCDSVITPTCVEYSELFECSVQFYECPSCGAVDADNIND